MSKVIGIVGSRRRDTEEDLNKVYRKLVEIYETGDTIVSGGCLKGGDRFAEVIADKERIPIVIHKPKWEWYGRGAGFVRNTLIADDCDILIACTAEDRKGGTEDTVKKAKKLGKSVIIV